MFARTPAGCSYISTLEALNKLTGIFGLVSIERKTRKSGCGLSEPSRFYRLCSHIGARCTFLMRTHDPEAAALAMALSAVATPSLEPIAM